MRVAAGAPGVDVLSTREKVGYGLGDAASNIVFQAVVNFLGFYYTDVFGLSPALVGTMFLLVRVVDAVTDPIMGLIADRTRTRWGRFRPYLLWGALPFGASAVLTFTVPDVAGGGKAVHAFATYSLLMLVYTFVNIPYCALGSVITDDPQERVSLQSWRFALAMAGSLVVMSGTLPLVEMLGGGDRAVGYQLAMTVLGTLAIVMLLMCFLSTRERVVPHSAHDGASLTADLRALLQNDQWRILAIVNFVLLVAIVLRGTVTLYYVTYVLQMPEKSAGYLTVATFGGIVGSLLAGLLAGGFNGRAIAGILALNVGLGAAFMAFGIVDYTLAGASLAASVAASAGCALLTARYDKTRAFTILMVAQGLLHVPLYAIGSESVPAGFFLFLLVLTLNQMAVPLLWAMMADSVDYGESRTGKRIAGLNFAATLFALKLGMATGGALAGWLLAAFGYVPNVAQADRSLDGIVLLFTLFPGAACVLVALISLRYGLTESRLREVRHGLAEAPIR